jgi:hypothetical protein
LPQLPTIREFSGTTRGFADKQMSEPAEVRADFSTVGWQFASTAAWRARFSSKVATSVAHSDRSKVAPSKRSLKTTYWWL